MKERVKNAALYFLVLSVIVLGLEDYYLRKAVMTTGRGYKEFLMGKFQGKPLGDVIHPGTLGLFLSNGEAFVCGKLYATVEKK